MDQELKNQYPLTSAV